MAEYIDRRVLKAESKTLLADAQVSPKAMTALYLGLILVLNVVSTLTGSEGILSTFVTILTSLMALVLHAGFVLYCMAIRRGERAEFLTIFDGFSFVGKIIALNIITFVFVFLWSMLFVIPGVIASYRYRFARLNLYENPEISVMEALALSKRQTFGYKGQLFILDLSYLGWSLLSSLPALFYHSNFYYETFRQTADQIVGASTIAALPLDAVAAVALPAIAWTLIMGLWQLVVSVFYYPHFLCTELGYFETAKRTSGTSAYSSRRPPWNDGPDNMGGF